MFLNCRAKIKGSCYNVFVKPCLRRRGPGKAGRTKAIPGHKTRNFLSCLPADGVITFCCIVYVLRAINYN